MKNKTMDWKTRFRSLYRKLEDDNTIVTNVAIEDFIQSELNNVIEEVEREANDFKAPKGVTVPTVCIPKVIWDKYKSIKK